MKQTILRSIFTPRNLLLSALASLAICSNAEAALITAFDIDQNRFGPWYVDNLVTTSNLSLNGGLARVGNSNNNISGWGLTLDTTKSVTFDITVDAGYEMSLTSFGYASYQGSGLAGSKPTTGAWGYRVDNGSGYGDWTYREFALLQTATGSATTWTFDQEVHVTGKIQFGFFAYGGNTAGGNANVTRTGTGDDMTINGTISPVAVPEPSTVVLASIGGLALLGLIRRARAKSRNA